MMACHTLQNKEYQNTKMWNNYQTVSEIQSILWTLDCNNVKLDFNKTSMFFDKIHVWNHDDQEVNKQWSILTVKLLYLTFEITTKTLSQ